VAVKSSVSANHTFTKFNGIGVEMGKPNWYVRNVAKRKHCLLTTISPRKIIIRRINMKPEEAKDILSDMRDQHLCFLGNSEIKDEWQKKYLKEAWTCDSGAKALAGLITEIKINKGVIAESILHYGKNNQSTVCMEECAELIQAISKAKRGKINRDNMIEEIADVLICIEMLKQMYMISDEKINNWIEKKQAREVERMEKNE
jgi:NTP pyrophosphatase (non-canonical NTP hydrolase)